MKKDSRFSTLGDAFDHYHDLAPHIVAPGNTIEEKVEWYQRTGETELIRLNTEAAARIQPPKPAAIPPRPEPPSRFQGYTIEQMVSSYQDIAPEDLVKPPTYCVTIGDKLQWYRETGEEELTRLADRAAVALTNELAAERSEIAELDRKIAAKRDEIRGHQLGIESAQTEIAGINELPWIIEFNRLSGEVAECDRQVAAIVEQERLLESFASNKGVAL